MAVIINKKTIQNYMTKNRIWQIAVGYLVIIIIIGFLDIHYNFNVGRSQIQNRMGWLT
jgi:hypothetical protein